MILDHKPNEEEKNWRRNKNSYFEEKEKPVKEEELCFNVDTSRVRKFSFLRQFPLTLVTFAAVRAIALRVCQYSWMIHIDIHRLFSNFQSFYRL